MENNERGNTYCITSIENCIFWVSYKETTICQQILFDDMQHLFQNIWGCLLCMCTVYGQMMISIALIIYRSYRFFLNFLQAKVQPVLIPVTATEHTVTVSSVQKNPSRKEKHWLTRWNSDSLVTSALSRDVRSWSALHSGGNVNIYRNYDGLFKLHEEIVTFSKRSYVKHPP